MECLKELNNWRINQNAGVVLKHWNLASLLYSGAHETRCQSPQRHSAWKDPKFRTNMLEFTYARIPLVGPLHALSLVAKQERALRRADKSSRISTWQQQDGASSQRWNTGKRLLRVSGCCWLTWLVCALVLVRNAWLLPMNKWNNDYGIVHTFKWCSSWNYWYVGRYRG